MWSKKEFEKITGCPQSTLLFYEREGLITPSRAENGYRKYGQKELEVMQIIRVLKYVQFSIPEMKELLYFFQSDTSEQCVRDSKLILLQKQKEIRRTIQQLDLIQHEFNKMIQTNNQQAYASQVEDSMRKINKDMKKKEDEK